MKKTSYKVVAEAMVLGKIKELEMPTENLNIRKLNTDEIMSIVREEFEKMKDINKMKLPPEKQFTDAETENQVDWMKKFNIKEFFNVK